MCPYYFDLEEKFLERAGIKPAATTDELFEEDDDVQYDSNCHLDNSDTGMNSDDSSDGLNEDHQKHLSDRSRRSLSTPRSNKRKDQRASKKKLGGGAEIDGFNALLMTTAKKKSAELTKSTVTNKSEDKVSKMVALMSNWKSARESMGCPIKAAYSCPEFEQFLDRNERKQLRRYRQDMEDPLSSDDSD